MKALGLILLAAAMIAGSAAAADYKAPRNAYGQPDLQGVWNSQFILPLESRPDTPKLVVPEAEAKVLAQRLTAEAAGSATAKLDPEIAEIQEADAKLGLAIVRGERRTRQVVQPPDGQIPLTRNARAQVRSIESIIRTNADPPLPTDNPELRPDWERCMSGEGQPPIATMNGLNPRQILQTRDTVVLLTEYGPDLRIIPFTDKHGPPEQTSALGDAIARWDGDTLVIETIRQPSRNTLRPFPVMLVPRTAIVTERYTRVSPRELLYQFTVSDPAIYAGPWLAEYSLYRTPHPILEFACHEGNYSLPNILAGARRKEQDAKAAAAGK